MDRVFGAMDLLKVAGPRVYHGPEGGAAEEVVGFGLGGCRGVSVQMWVRSLVDDDNKGGWASPL